MPLSPFIFEHHTVSEGGCHKTHVFNGIKILCGVVPGAYSSGTLHTIDMDWLMQPDYQNELCKKCKKIAIKLLKP